MTLNHSKPEVGTEPHAAQFDVAAGYHIAECRAGWLVYKGHERWPVSHGHATRESAEEWIWDRQAEEARDEFRKVTCVLPYDADAHPFSGRRGEY